MSLLELAAEGMITIILIVVGTGVGVVGAYLLGLLLLYPAVNLPSLPLTTKFNDIYWRETELNLPEPMYEHSKILWIWIGIGAVLAAVVLLLAAIGGFLNEMGVNLL